MNGTLLTVEGLGGAFAPGVMKLCGDGFMPLVVLWEWKRGGEGGRSRDVRGKSSHGGVHTRRPAGRRGAERGRWWSNICVCDRPDDSRSGEQGRAALRRESLFAPHTCPLVLMWHL